MTREPRHRNRLAIGRPRTSTLVLIGLFLGFLTLYVLVRPIPESNTGNVQQATPTHSQTPPPPATTPTPSHHTLSPTPSHSTVPSVTHTPTPATSSGIGTAAPTPTTSFSTSVTSPASPPG